MASRLITPPVLRSASPALVELARVNSHTLEPTQLPGGTRTLNIFGVPVKSYDLRETTSLVASWASMKETTRLVSFTNVHMVTESHHRPAFRDQLCAMDLNCLDGMPLVWLAKLSARRVTRVCGPDFFEEFFAGTAGDGLRHFFYGGNEGVAEKVATELTRRYPALQVAGFATPPFRPLTEDEDASVVEMINNSGADVVWVSLGCPKQEAWMYEHRSKLKPCVLLAVGMAFDIIVGEKQRAPEMLRKAGLEWFYRLVKEPRRLGTRYIKSNLTFLLLLLAGLPRMTCQAAKQH